MQKYLCKCEGHTYFRFGKTNLTIQVPLLWFLQLTGRGSRIARAWVWHPGDRGSKSMVESKQLLIKLILVAS